jgi:hypothetical protein
MSPRLRTDFLDKEIPPKSHVYRDSRSLRRSIRRAWPLKLASDVGAKCRGRAQPPADGHACWRKIGKTFASTKGLDFVRQVRKLVIKPEPQLHCVAPQCIKESAIVEYGVNNSHRHRQDDYEPRRSHGAVLMNLTPTKRASTHTTSQFRWMAPLNSTKVKVRGKSVSGCAMARRAPPFDISRITQWTGGLCAPTITSATRRIGYREVFRSS